MPNAFNMKPMMRRQVVPFSVSAMAGQLVWGAKQCDGSFWNVNADILSIILPFKKTFSNNVFVLHRLNYLFQSSFDLRGAKTLKPSNIKSFQ